MPVVSNIYPTANSGAYLMMYPQSNLNVILCRGAHFEVERMIFYDRIVPPMLLFMYNSRATVIHLLHLPPAFCSH